jgi:hypothetical protein
MNDDLIKILKEAMDKGLLKPDGVDALDRSLKGAAESADDAAKAQSNASSKGRTFLNSLTGNTKGLGEFHSRIQESGAATERLKTQIADAERELEKMSSSMSDEERAQKKRTIERLKTEHDNAKATHDQQKKQGEAAEESGKSFKSFIGTLYRSIMTTTDTLLSSTDTIGITITALKSGIDVASKSVGFVADFVKMFTGLGKAGKLAELGLDALGDVAEVGGEVLKDIVDLLGKEVAKTVSAYQKMSTVGATFAGGMEEMRDVAQSANMGLEEFNRIVVDNAKDFSAAGLGMTEAAKRFASVSKTMSESGLRQQIGNLGYSFEEFGGLTADVMARLGTSGQLNFKSDQEIGQLTVEYAKNLRLISNVTGEDARKKMDEARKSALKAGVYEKVLQQGGAEGLKKFQEMIALVPPQLQQGLMEYVATGGTAVRDVATNMALQQIPGMKDLFSNFLSAVSDPMVNSTQATGQLLDNLKGVGEQLKQSNATIGDIGRAAILGVTGPAAEFSTLVSGLREVTSKMPPDVQKLREEIEKMALDPGKLSKNMSEMNEAIQRSKSAAEDLADKGLTPFSRALVKTAETMDAVTGKLKDLLDGIPSPAKIPQSARQLGQAAPGTIPGVAPSESSSAWDTVGVPGRSGAKDKPNTAKKLDGTSTTSTSAMPFDTSKVDRYALGGITSGISIAGEQGPEAVVPLPNGKTIPVEIKSTEAVYSQFEQSAAPPPTDSSGGLESFLQNQLKAMQNSASTLENILTVLRDSYDTQDRLLANSY